ncbi:MAG: hypothetical protein HY362_04405 [Candidatus Aenigmarchaeota archaeon]|nr:hypothetical protein [Candidatus Aenigmarchaeota archaeon]
MKSVFIAGSRKFYLEIVKLLQLLKSKGINAKTAGEWDSSQQDTLESEKSALLRAFKEIDNIDFVYIYSKDGYIGKTVALEIAYSYAKNKPIISSETIEDFSAQALISGTVSPEKLVDYCFFKKA